MKKSSPRPMTPSQGQKFLDAARELGCDESEDHFDVALKKVAAHKSVGNPPPPKMPETKKPAE